ncbi:MAG: zinc-ribbon domain-containing protein [Lachnospiraceae bacterium]|nr:zinc-ribbon domain-containing protein [Lachnospiraceae bacterium]
MRCKNCGYDVPEGEKFCSNCGTPITSEFEQPIRRPVPNTTQTTRQRQPRRDDYNRSNDVNVGPSLAIGIISLVLSIVGATMFGTIVALIALALGIVGLVLSINVRKRSNEEKGLPAFICSLLGLIFGAIFACACTFCGACSCGYGFFGFVGSSCLAKKAADEATEQVQEQIDILTDEIDKAADEYNKAVDESLKEYDKAMDETMKEYDKAMDETMKEYNNAMDDLLNSLGK